MDSYFAIYALFALTTAFAGMYELIHPTIVRRNLHTPQLNYTSLYYLVFFCLSLLTAPALFLCAIVPAYAEMFRNTLYTSLMEDTK